MSRDRNKVPRLGGQDDKAGTVMSRGRVLDKTVQVAYGPGQPPDALNVQYPDPVGYEPPTDWTPAGFLLRMPQVVWLSAIWPDPPGPITVTFGNVLAGQETSGPGWTYNTTLYYARSYNHTTTPPPADPEIDRLAIAFAGAKATVEALRPGRTYVNLIDWIGAVDGNTHLVPGACPYLTCPDVGTGFAGTDFLHIYCGSYAEDVLQDDGVTVERSPGPDAPDPGALAGAVARVRAGFAKFAGFAVRVYTDATPPAGWAVPLPRVTAVTPYERVGDPPVFITETTQEAMDLANPPRLGIDPGGAYIVVQSLAGDGTPDGLSLIGDVSYPPGWPRYPGTTRPWPAIAAPAGDGGLAAYQAVARNVEIDAINALPSASAVDSGPLFAASIAQLDDDGNDYGVAVAGDTSALTADSIVALIAAHYGFDPTTGADLP